MSCSEASRSRLVTAKARRQTAENEFQRLLSQARQDDDPGIREASTFIARMLEEKARGWLDEEDIVILLEGQREMALLRANNAQIALRSRIQTTLIHLIDLALSTLLKAA